MRKGGVASNLEVEGVGKLAQGVCGRAQKDV